jgi:flavin-dependent dehydrogenase
MNRVDWDVIVIGGGPGGSSTASYLSKAGHRTLVLEKEHFPRFHIGESLLPYNAAIFEELGLLHKLEAHGFVKKHGAQFHLGNGSKSMAFVFKDGKFTRHTEAFQVERSVFDDLLLKHARDCGACVLEGTAVDRFMQTEERVEVATVDSSGTRQSFTARFLVDASGRSNLTGNQEKLREVHPRLKKLAIFGHFKGVRRDPGPKGGDTVIVRLKNNWFWLIPISHEKISVGCVIDRDEFAATKQSPETVFWNYVEASPPLRERMANAVALGEIQTTGDFSYRNKRLVGPRLLRVGDAAGFMDPIFSAGVYLAMLSGKLAAKSVMEAIHADDDGAERFLKYEARVRSCMSVYWEMVERFYTTSFMEVFLEPRARWNIPAAVNAILAGELEGRFAMKLRLNLFFLIVRLQRHWPLVPRISFEAIRPGESNPRDIQSSVRSETGSAMTR